LEAEIGYALLDDIFLKHRKPDEAIAMEAYMKHKFSFYGIKAPERRKLFTQVWREIKPKKADETYYKFLQLCWNSEYREMQMSAMDAMDQLIKKMDKSWIPHLESFILEKSWWDSVDWLAVNGVGRMFDKYPEERDKYIYRWIESESIWLQRTAILFQLKYKEKIDWNVMQDFILKTSGTKEFFINKASGWALREYSKTNPEAVLQFVNDHPDLSSLTKREALKHIVA
jgi:3-methyladenine DNA glycosylase AlkD